MRSSQGAWLTDFLFSSSTVLISEAWREELKDLATKVSLSAAAKRAEHEVEEQMHLFIFLELKKKIINYVSIKCLHKKYLPVSHSSMEKNTSQSNTSNFIRCMFYHVVTRSWGIQDQVGERFKLFLLTPQY